MGPFKQLMTCTEKGPYSLGGLMRVEKGGAVHRRRPLPFKETPGSKKTAQPHARHSLLLCLEGSTLIYGRAKCDIQGAESREKRILPKKERSCMAILTERRVFFGGRRSKNVWGKGGGGLSVGKTPSEHGKGRPASC